MRRRARPRPPADAARLVAYRLLRPAVSSSSRAGAPCWPTPGRGIRPAPRRPGPPPARPDDQPGAARGIAAAISTSTLPASGYRLFAELAAEAGFVTYEAVTAAPDEHCARLCGLLDVAFDPGYAERWAGWKKITGDIGPQAAAMSRRRSARIPRFPVPPDLLPRLADQCRLPGGAGAARLRASAGGLRRAMAGAHAGRGPVGLASCRPEAGRRKPEPERFQAA